MASIPASAYMEYPSYINYPGSNTYVNFDPGSYYYTTLAQQSTLNSMMYATMPPPAPKKPHKYASLKQRVAYRIEYKEWMSQNALWQSDQQLKQEEIKQATPKYYVNTPYPGHANPLGNVDSGLGTIAPNTPLAPLYNPPNVNWSYHISPTGQLTT